MAELRFVLEGSESDLDFIKERCHGRLLDLVDEYEQNLDGPIEISWELE